MMLVETKYALAAAAATFAFSLWRWFNERPDLVNYTHRTQLQVDRLEELMKRLNAAAKAASTKAKPTPAAGPFRTAPIGDPNVESKLPEPTPQVEVKLVRPWDAKLICPVCGCNNRHTKSGDVHSATQGACNGCDAHPAPHLHVTCWNCKFKFGLNTYSERDDEPS